MSEEGSHIFKPLDGDVLYFSSAFVTTHDVPDEIALAISLSGCPIHCKGCHSAFTWDPKFGEELTNDKFISLLDRNKYASCVLFYGGEWKIERLLELIAITEKRGLKTCLYTGLELNAVDKRLLDVLNYIKVGRYIEELGGLASPTTNQRFFKIR